jgi:hypothetical protein
MDVLVTIMVVDETGDEIPNVSASADTAREAFELAMQEVDVDGV